MSEKHIVVLAGNYPDGTLEKLCNALPKEVFTVKAINDPDEYAKMSDAEIIILRIFKAPAEIISNNQNLKMILRWGAGFDSVDIKEAGKRGIFVTNTPGANAYAVSEMTVLLMLAIGRKLLCHIDSLRNGIWSKNDFINQTVTLNHKSVGIVGGGNIGRQVAKKVQAFGSRVQYYDVFRLSPELEQQFDMTYVSLDELLKTSDVVSLHVPMTEENYHMIGKNQIDQMKQGAILINVARGGLVDEAALLEAIKAGKLSGAGIDCVENEPLSAQDPLLNESNVIVMPHVGGGSADLADAIIPMLVNDIVDWQKTGKPSHIVNREFLEKAGAGQH